MKARVTKEFQGRRDDKTVVETIKVDDIIEGDLAALAVREKWAREIDEAAEAKAAQKRADAQAAVDAAQAGLDQANAALAAALDDKKADAGKAVDAAQKALDAANAALAKLS